MLKLYIANKNYSSWSLRPWVLMRELSIAFEEKLVPFPSSGANTDFREFSPTGRVPCLIDGATTIWDSLAITEYVAESHPAVWPADRIARAWSRSAAAEIHSGFTCLRDTCGMNCGVRIRIHDYPPAALRDWARIDALWNEGLARFGGPFLAGRDFTAADAFYAPVAFRVQTYDPPLSARSSAYVRTLLDLKSMKDWYGAALLEPWREEAHEREARLAGEWLQDLRS
jgi:glutathione S-transferase